MHCCFPDVVASASSRNNALLKRRCGDTSQLYPNSIASMRITLPWQRTFETEIDVALAPNL